MCDCPCRICKGGKLTHNLCKPKCKRYAFYKDELRKIKADNREAWKDVRAAGRYSGQEVINDKTLQYLYAC